MRVSEIPYAGHIIKAGTLASGPAANVFRPYGKKLSKVHSVTAKTEDEVVSAAKAWVDEHQQANADQRPSDEVHGCKTGTVADFVYALEALNLSTAERLMLRAHVAAPERRLSPTELSVAANYASHSSANLAYGKLGRKVAEMSDLPIPLSTITGKPLPTGVLARFISGEGTEASWIWEMRENLAEALGELNIGTA